MINITFNRKETGGIKMYVKNKLFNLTFKFTLVLIGTMALLNLFGVFEGRFNVRELNYFTILSNLLCVAYFAVDFVHLAINRHGEVKMTGSPVLKGIAMMSVTVTMLVSHFMLKTAYPPGSIMGLTILALHYIVPSMTILDWLLFDRKGFITKISPLIWTIAPLVYFGYAMIAARIGDGIGYSSRYPYPFMDVDALGFGQVLWTVLILLIVFVALGFVFYAIDRTLLKLGNPNQKKAASENY